MSKCSGIGKEYPFLDVNNDEWMASSAYNGSPSGSSGSASRTVGKAQDLPCDSLHAPLGTSATSSGPSHSSHGLCLPTSTQENCILSEAHLSGTPMSSPFSSWFTPADSPGNSSGRSLGGGMPARGGGGMSMKKRSPRGKGGGGDFFTPNAACDVDAPPSIRQQAVKGVNEYTTSPARVVDHFREEGVGGDVMHFGNPTGRNGSGLPGTSSESDEHGEAPCVSSPLSTPLSDGSGSIALGKLQKKNNGSLRGPHTGKSSPIAIPHSVSFQSYRGYGAEAGGLANTGSVRIGVNAAFGLGATAGSLFPSSLQVGTYELDALPIEASLSAGLGDVISMVGTRAAGIAAGSYRGLGVGFPGDMEGSPRGYFGSEAMSCPASPDIFLPRNTEEELPMSKIGSSPGGVREAIEMQGRRSGHGLKQRGGSFGVGAGWMNEGPKEYIQPSALASSFPDLTVNSGPSQDHPSPMRSGSHSLRMGPEEFVGDFGVSGSFPSSSLHVDSSRKSNDMHHFDRGRNKVGISMDKEKKDINASRENLQFLRDSPFSLGMDDRLYEMEDDPDAPPFMRKNMR